MSTTRSPSSGAPTDLVSEEQRKLREGFRNLPPEVLQTSMKEHQKFLSLRNPKTGRIEGFVTVANTEAPDGGALILAGNQKVLAARLSDAKFFWENDLRVAEAGMGDWQAALEAVTFHGKLGSQGDRVKRITSLAGEIAPAVGADPERAREAARKARELVQRKSALLSGGAEGAGSVLSLLTWFVFGAVVFGYSLQHFDWQVLVYAVLSLTAVRMVPGPQTPSGRIVSRRRPRRCRRWRPGTSR
mgnify:CR=1 FL=1